MSDRTSPVVMVRGFHTELQDLQARRAGKAGRAPFGCKERIVSKSRPFYQASLNLAPKPKSSTPMPRSSTTSGGGTCTPYTLCHSFATPLLHNGAPVLLLGACIKGINASPAVGGTAQHDSAFRRSTTQLSADPSGCQGSSSVSAGAPVPQLSTRGQVCALSCAPCLDCKPVAKCLCDDIRIHTCPAQVQYLCVGTITCLSNAVHKVLV